MRLTDAAGWAAAVAANPPPAGCPPEPEEWPPYEQLTAEQRGDAYGNIVIVAAQRWAEAMEPRLDAGDQLADIADETFRAVDRDLGSLGLTAFQYGAAVSILAHVWWHGEELRRWHNLAIQTRDEGERANETGGVLNPALLSLEERPS